ncbi:MAG TPA: hypothetical protein VIL69_16510 [Roseomonas sp.]
MTTDIGLVLAGCLAPALVFVALRSLGLPFGLRVEHSGEDYNWLRILAAPTLAQKVNSFWTLDWRNPLSPWWYILAEPIYEMMPRGPLILRLLMNPLLAFAAYFMIRSATEGRARLLALCAALVIGIWTFGYSTDHVLWNILGAAGLSMLCVGCYATWLAGGRNAVGWYGLSLILWFAAFATYAFQMGAILAIGLLCLLRPPPGAAVVRRLVVVAFELLPFAIIAILFLLIWITTRHPTMSDAVALAPERLIENVLGSLRHGIWPQEYRSFAEAAWARLGWGLPALAAGMGVLAAVLAGVVSREDRAVAGRDAALALALAACLVLPTLLIESTSNTWTVGTRWRMVHQMWLPLLWLGSIGLTAAALPLADWARRWCLLGGAGIASALVLCVSLGHNTLQISLSAAQAALRAGLATVTEGRADPVDLLVLVSPEVPWLTAEALPDVVPVVWFPGRDVSLRVLRPGPVLTPHYGNWLGVRLTEAAAINLRNGGGAAPYTQVRILRFDGRKITMPAQIDVSDVAIYPVSWERDAPLVQPP